MFCICLLELMLAIVYLVADAEHNISHSAREDQHCVVSIIPFICCCSWCPLLWSLCPSGPYSCPGSGEGISDVGTPMR
jgi:hypothetical protein